MRERADAYRPHMSGSTFTASSRPGAASRLRRGAVVGRRLAWTGGEAQDPHVERLRPRGLTRLPNNGLTLFIAKSGGRQTLVIQRASGRPLTCRDSAQQNTGALRSAVKQAALNGWQIVLLP